MLRDSLELFLFLNLEDMEREPYSFHGVGRALCSLSLFLFFMRILKFYSLSRNLGVKVLMIYHMVQQYILNLNDE